MLCANSTAGNCPESILALARRPPDPNSSSLSSSPKDPISPSPAPPQSLGQNDVLPPFSTPPRSYVSAVAANTIRAPSKNQNHWTFVGADDLVASTFEGEPELKISDKFKERLCVSWKKTLVIRLLGRSVAYSYLCSQLRGKWRPTGSMDIMDLNNDTFLVTLGNDQDYLNALTGGPWVILDHYLMVHPWSPSFRLSDKPHRSVIAWVQLPELPVHFYHREVLFDLGNLIGRTIKLDYHTENLERGKFARIAVELDMSKPLPWRIRLDGVWQKVLYENLPQICFECGCIGHKEDSCIKLLVGKTPVLPDSADPALSSSLENSPSESPAGFGPWMQVTRKSRRINRSQPTNHAFHKVNVTTNSGVKGNSWEKSATKGKIDLASSTVSFGGKGKVEQNIINIGQRANQACVSAARDGKAAINGKGSVGQKSGLVEGNSNSHKGKAIDMMTLGENNEDKSKDWKAAGVKKGHMSSDAQPFEPQAQTPQTQMVLGPNNTKIHIIQVPPLTLPSRANSEPTSGNSSVRQHYQRKNQSELSATGKKKGISLNSIKKPLQVANTKKELHQRVKDPSFPITLKSIEDFLSQSHQKLVDISNMETGTLQDMMMVENRQEPVAVEVMRSTSQDTPALAT